MMLLFDYFKTNVYPCMTINKQKQYMFEKYNQESLNDLLLYYNH